MIFLVPQFKRLRRKPVYQHACKNAVKYTKCNRRHPECKYRDSELHYVKGHQICRCQHKPVCPAFYLRPCIIRLQKVINSQIMHREKYAHTYYRNKKYQVIQGVIRPSRQIQQQRKTNPDDKRRQKVYLYDFPQPD